MNLQRLKNLATPVMEPILRGVVKEEVDSAIRRHMINRERNDIHQSESRNLQLQFSNAISIPVFIGTRIKGEGSTTIEVALVDAPNKQVVSNGPGSFGKVQIVVLRGDFGGDGGENWRLEEFTRNIVREREGKKPLLTGHVILTLKDGKGLLDVSFTDNSSWTRTGKFRLGARLVDDIDGIKVREAISEPFIVKNRPRESNTKHDPPSLSDEVWRLENIRKDGSFHKSLSREGVNTVEDFLISLSSHPTGLQNILRTMSTKKWEVTVQHAQRCVLDRKLYAYYGSTSPRTNGVVFNVVRQVKGMFKDGQYVSAEKLSHTEKVNARELVISAFGNRDKIVTLGDESSLNVPPSLPSSNTDHQYLSSPNIGSFPHTQQHDASSPGITKSLWSIGGASSFDDFLHDLGPMDVGCDQLLSSPNQASDILTNAVSCANEKSNFTEMNSTAVIDNFAPSSSVVPINKVRGRWDVLVSLLRWRFAIKRIVARKTLVWAIPQDDDVTAWISLLQ